MATCTVARISRITAHELVRIRATEQVAYNKQDTKIRVDS